MWARSPAYLESRLELYSGRDKILVNSVASVVTKVHVPILIQTSTFRTISAFFSGLYEIRSMPGPCRRRHRRDWSRVALRVFPTAELHYRSTTANSSACRADAFSAL